MELNGQTVVKSLREDKPNCFNLLASDPGTVFGGKVWAGVWFGPSSGVGRSDMEGRFTGGLAGASTMVRLSSPPTWTFCPCSPLGPSTSNLKFHILYYSVYIMLKTYGLSGQQTPGTNRDLKQMEPLNILRFTRSRGQSWISWHLPLPPWEVVQEGESLGDLLVTWSPPPWKFPPCLPWDLSPPPPPLIAPPIALTPAPRRPSPWVNWAATGSSRLVTFVPRTFLPTTRGKVLKLAMGANN